jgi:GNAT superfamily N-acetyltransferase
MSAIDSRSAPESVVSIRRAALADSASILRCLQSAFESYRQNYTSEAFLDTVLTPESLARRFTTMSVFVAVDARDQIVGTVACQQAPNSGKDEHPKHGHIRGMAVLPDWQGRHVAQKLLEKIESELRMQNCTHIALDTTEPLRQAMRFCEKHGFRRSGKVETFFLACP